MKYTTKVPKRHIFYAYLKTTNGINNLSPQEMKVLAELMHHHKSYLEKAAYSLPGVNLFSTDTRKIIAFSLKMSPHNLNNLLGTIKKKGLIVEVGRTDLELCDKLNKFVAEFISTGKASITFELLLV